MTPNENIIRQAIIRELSREGQIYFIHNRVETIFAQGDRLKRLFPHANIAVVHGQMSSSAIDTVFHGFKSGKIDILVATTIVENGIDIPNANTILIDNANHFGLADLYQLRGRVGRWNKKAWAYFIVKRPDLMSEVSRKRMEALAQTSGYGGGMKLAMRDLEIRGAGDVLGLEQSGQVAAIGFHFYCKLLKKTIKAMQNGVNESSLETKIEHPFNAKLPSDYVNEISLRMDVYQRLGDALTLPEVTDIIEELKDRFGPLPEQVLWLFHITRIKIVASNQNIITLKIQNNRLLLEKNGSHEKFVLKPYSSPQELEISIFSHLINN